jgi:hypothetical protein
LGALADVHSGMRLPIAKASVGSAFTTIVAPASTR